MLKLINYHDYGKIYSCKIEYKNISIKKYIIKTSLNPLKYAS